jgi:type VI secretion system protein ImpL
VAALTFEDRGGARPNLAFQGPWALYRLLDAGKLHSTADVRYTISFLLNGHEARYILEASSIRNPFLKDELQQFRCGG